jgi:phosphate starvation-inducible PhoH-like protein
MARHKSRQKPVQQRTQQVQAHKDQAIAEPRDKEYENTYFELNKLELITQSQHDYYNSIKQNIITFGFGCAGTGKSFIPVAYAAEQLLKKKVKKIVFTRPAIECGESYGFLPGELDEKMEPYYQPIKDILYKIIGKGHTDYYIKRQVIEFRPLAFMRGSTFSESIVILDESENTTPGQMKMFLTRIGDDCKVIINGDIAQSDIKGNSGLSDGLHRLQHVRKVGFVEFGIDDIVRSGICKDIIKAYA